MKQPMFQDYSRQVIENMLFGMCQYFLQASSCRPTNSIKALKEYEVTLIDLHSLCLHKHDDDDDDAAAAAGVTCTATNVSRGTVVRCACVSTTLPVIRARNVCLYTTTDSGRPEAICHTHTALQTSVKVRSISACYSAVSTRKISKPEIGCF